VAHRITIGKEMNNVVKTQFIGRSPFKGASEGIDISTLKITNDKKKTRTIRSYKYDALFAQMQPGKSISCKPGDAGSIYQSLKSYAKRMEKNWIVSVNTYYTANTARVFVEERA
jgi:hypothetical protein